MRIKNLFDRQSRSMKYLNKCQRDVMHVTSTNDFLPYKE
jgi:hypothetical protein